MRVFILIVLFIYIVWATNAMTEVTKMHKGSVGYYLGMTAISIFYVAAAVYLFMNVR